MEDKALRAIEANTERMLLQTVRNDNTVSGIGTKEKPFEISIPKEFDKKDMALLMEGMSGILLEASKENGILFVSFQAQ